MRRHLLGSALAAAAVLAATGCGTGGLSKGGDPATGKTLFIAKCGSCHTMADAGTQGKVGPNLDDAFAGDRRQGYKESTIQQVVRDQIELASPPMPPNLVRGQDADSVAAYVAMCAGRPQTGTPCVTASQGGGGTTTGGTTTTTTATGTTTTTATGTTSTGATGATTTTGTTAAGDADHGKALYTSLGCVGCHTLSGEKSTGPTFKGLAGSQVKLADGSTVTADDAYLLESITDPDKQIVAGYSAGIMSSVIKPGQVSRDDANDLVAFIKQQK